MEKGTNSLVSQEGRLLSVDLFRGLTMFLLIAEFTRLYDLFNRKAQNPQASGNETISCLNELRLTVFNMLRYRLMDHNAVNRIVIIQFLYACAEIFG